MVYTQLFIPEKKVRSGFHLQNNLCHFLDINLPLQIDWLHYNNKIGRNFYVSEQLKAQPEQPSTFYVFYVGQDRRRSK